MMDNTVDPQKLREPAAAIVRRDNNGGGIVEHDAQRAIVTVLRILVDRPWPLVKLPASMSQMPEGGIGMLFVQGDRRASIGVYPEGETTFATWWVGPKTAEPLVWSIKNPTSIPLSVEKLLMFLDGEFLGEE